MVESPLPRPGITLHSCPRIAIRAIRAHTRRGARMREKGTNGQKQLMNKGGIARYPLGVESKPSLEATGVDARAVIAEQYARAREASPLDF